MKTLFLTTSKKKHRKWANSTYFMTLAKYHTQGEKVHIHLEGKKDYPRIIETLKECEHLVIATPVYVDAIPSHVVELLQVLEKEELNYTLYIVTCCGFYEAKQCHILLKQMELFAKKAGITYGGGLGVGGSEMLGIIRLTNGIVSPLIALFILLVCLLLGMPMHTFMISLGISILVPYLLILLWSLGLLKNTAQLAKSMNAHQYYGNRYTTVTCCGVFLFECFANLFWIVRAAGNKISYKQMYRQIEEKS